MFHVSKLKKCMADEPLAIALDEIQVDDKLHFIKEPVEIMEREVKRLKQSRIPIVKGRDEMVKGTDISQKDEKPSKKRQKRTRDGKVCEDEARSKSSQLREEKAKKNIT
ncbi:hypothetical protein Tco_1056935 [Tanacetum coccineum]|uniref:Reverse transcriptase domain-containing protein n=1 Tax=Tanacetum coccineum TaxID=301880 RepID=A0ABQ5H3X2_9ASTR